MNLYLRISLALSMIILSPCDAKMSELEKPLKYASDVKQFSEGLAGFQLGTTWALKENINVTNSEQNQTNVFGRWGYIDKNGQMAIDVQFDQVGDFHHGLAPVMLGNKWGLIDKSGKFVVQPKYNGLNRLNNGYIAIESAQNIGLRMGYLDEAGKEIVKVKYAGIKNIGSNLYAYRENNLWGLLNSKGEVMTLPLFNFINFQENNDLITISVNNFGIAKWGAIDKTGKIVIEPQYDQLIPSQNGVLLSRVNRKWGLVTNKGEMIVPPTYEIARPFSEGFSAILLDGKWGFMDIFGRIIVKPQYDFVGDYHEKRAVYGNSSGFITKIMNYGYLNQQGQEIVEPIYISALNFTEHLASVCKDSFGPPSCGYIDENGTLVINNVYSTAEEFKNGYARVSTYTKFPIQYFPKYIDKAGKVVLDTDSDKGIKWNPNPIIKKIIFDWAFRMSDISSEGMISFMKNGKWGLMDQSGKIIVEPQYKSIDTFKDGLAKVITMDGKGKFIDATGNVVLQ
jgi:hypothetical protein